METMGDGMCMGFLSTVPFLSILKNGDTSNLSTDMHEMSQKDVDVKIKCIDEHIKTLTTNLTPVIPDYNVFLLRFYETTEPLLLHVCNMIRAAVPNAVILLGDKNNFMDELFETHLPIDSLISGFGEEPVEDVLVRISDNQEIPSRYVGSIPKGDYFPEHEEIYKDGLILIRTSYACLYNCAFCSNFTRTISREQRIIDIEKTIREIGIIRDKYAPTELRLCDSLFYTKPEDLDAFYDGLVKNDLMDIQFPDTNICTTDTLKYPEGLTRLNATFRIGFEHLNDNMLESVNKGCTGKQNMEVVRILANAGKLLKGNFIYGLPNESIPVFDDFIKQLQILDRFERSKFHVNINRFRIRTGSPMYVEPEKFGIEMLYDEDISKYFNLDQKSVMVGYRDDTLAYKDRWFEENLLGTSADNFPILTGGKDSRYNFEKTVKFYKG
jgi:hypothetical protein